MTFGHSSGLDPRSPVALARRLAELRAESSRFNREIAKSRRRANRRATCRTCGCTPDTRCWIRLDGDLGVARCASAGDVPGHDVCSACLAPELRVSQAAWLAALSHLELAS
jgi:hypothetical protein